VIAARREQIARETLIIKRLLFIFPGAASRSFSASRWNGRKRRTLELFAVAGCFLLKKCMRGIPKHAVCISCITSAGSLCRESDWNLLQFPSHQFNYNYTRMVMANSKKAWFPSSKCPKGKLFTQSLSFIALNLGALITFLSESIMFSKTQIISEQQRTF
jgi:hypothetical protein